MRKDWVVWSVAIALFVAGALWSRLFGLYPAGGSWVDLVGLLTALGTLGAAIAAWKAAAKSGEQLEQMQQQARWQQYDLHYRQFGGLLAELEKLTEVSFLHKWEFYEDLFPVNRKFSESFALKCTDRTITVWDANYHDLLRRSQVRVEPSSEIVVEWIKDLFRLANSLCLELIPHEQKQLRTSNRDLSFGVGPQNARVALFKIGIVLNSLSRFCEEGKRVDHKPLSDEFMQGVLMTLTYPNNLPQGFIVD